MFYETVLVVTFSTTKPPEIAQFSGFTFGFGFWFWG
jgi:hypothetical protein